MDSNFLFRLSKQIVANLLNFWRKVVDTGLKYVLVTICFRGLCSFFDLLQRMT